MELSTFNNDLIADLADPEFARQFVARVQDEVNRTAAALEATCQREEREREALAQIAQYDPRWKGQHVNNAPSRAQLIELAYDAWIAEPL